eukprot:Hpha_TRINITY_DN16279_c2_g2::TRINITY_DN16279_c2_g2_i1::g.11865::m.11865
MGVLLAVIALYVAARFLYGAPQDANVFLIVDSDTDTYDISLNAKAGTNKWQYIARGPDGKLYGAPHDATDVVVVDPSDSSPTGSVSFIPLGSFQQERWAGVAPAINGKMYFAPSNAAEVLILDTANGGLDFSVQVRQYSKTQKWNGIAAGADGKLYCAPCAHSDMLVIDPVSDALDYVPTKAGASKWRGIVSAENKVLYAAPADEESVLRYDPARGGSPQYLSVGKDPHLSHKWQGIVDGGNGKVYASPWTHSSILVVDTITNLVDFIDLPTVSASKARYGGIALSPNGKLYLSPAKETAVAVCDTGTHAITFIHLNHTLLNSADKWMGMVSAAGAPTPSISPSAAPSDPPTQGPSLQPSFPPTAAPSASPTAAPSLSPAVAPTTTPTKAPAPQSLVVPTRSPAATGVLPPPSTPPTGSPVSVSSSAPPTRAGATSPSTAPTGSPVPLGVSLAPTIPPLPPPTKGPGSPGGIGPSAGPSAAPRPVATPTKAPGLGPGSPATRAPGTVVPSTSPKVSLPPVTPTASPTQTIDNYTKELAMVCPLPKGADICTTATCHYMYCQVFATGAGCPNKTSMTPMNCALLCTALAANPRCNSFSYARSACALSTHCEHGEGLVPAEGTTAFLRVEQPPESSADPLPIVLAALGAFLCACLLCIPPFLHYRRKKQLEEEGERIYAGSGLKEEDLADWKKGKLLGKGAAGSVYEGLLTNGWVVAVKVIELGSHKAPGEEEMVMHELDILSKIQHERVVRYFGAEMRKGPDGSELNVFMEYVPGGSLASILRKFGALDL